MSTSGEGRFIAKVSVLRERLYPVVWRRTRLAHRLRANMSAFISPRDVTHRFGVVAPSRLS